MKIKINIEQLGNNTLLIYRKLNTEVVQWLAIQADNLKVKGSSLGSGT